MKQDHPLLAQMCQTCPFQKGSPYANLVPELTVSALGEASRICHSTGTNAINGRTGKPSMLCRGARDAQLRFFFSIGFIESPTDAAWLKKRKELNV